MLRQIIDLGKHRVALSGVHSHRNHLVWCLRMDLADAYNQELVAFQKRVASLKPVKTR